ncbi:hypothetical protein [Nonomuraea sp. KM90]|uniref:hypothetical protein n=1 Tax=Nonomuraea sp. KM90 TaxID=3457428 RepID=UPI003FCD8555
MSADSGQQSGDLLREFRVHLGVAVEQPVPHPAEDEVDGQFQARVRAQAYDLDARKRLRRLSDDLIRRALT